MDSPTKRPRRSPLRDGSPQQMEPLAYELELQQHGTTQQATRLVEDLTQCRSQSFDVEPLRGSPLAWRALLSSFPPDSRLGQDLMALYRGSQTREACIEILLEFPASYPAAPFSLRIVEPDRWRHIRRDSIRARHTASVATRNDSGRGFGSGTPVSHAKRGWS